MRFYGIRKCIALLVLGAFTLQAQQVSGPKASLVQQTGDIKIVVIEGEGAVNNIRSRMATQPVVEVRDEQDKPIPGAEVVFQLPAAGPGGTFNGWMRTQTVRTNEQGRAASTGLAPNEEEGRYNIKATATHGTKTNSLVIAQSNSRGGPGGAQAKSRRGLWTAIAVIGGAALIGGIVAATRNGDSAATPATIPVTVSSGPITVGGPR
ncbi:MAG: carboxypeptidase-like regulatory domain-containing protein [Bryobacteraceae bacterium]